MASDDDEEDDISDSEVPLQPQQRRQRGRPSTGGRQSRSTGGAARNGKRGPARAADSVSPRERSARPRSAPQSLADEQAAARREKKQRKRSIAAAIEQHVPDTATIADVRTLV